MTLRIGISARLSHNPPAGLGLPTKRLQFLESGMAQWIMSHGVLALMIPFIDQRMPGMRKRPPIHDLVDNLDGHQRRIGRLTVSIPGRLKKSLDQHTRIVRKIKAGDADGAEAEMRAHVANVMEDQLANFAGDDG